MDPVCLDEYEAFEELVGVCCGKVFVDGMLCVDWIAWAAPGESVDFGGGVEMDVGVDYGNVGFGCFGHCAVSFESTRRLLIYINAVDMGGNTGFIIF